MSECVLCESMDRYERPEAAKRTTWSLTRHGYGDWTMDVAIENTRLGVAMVTGIPVDHCPDCGRELR